MKATLEYHLPDEEGQFKMACRSFDYHSALWDLQQLVREYEKYENMSIDTFLDRAKDILYDVMLDDIP
jgi:hypothetical protein